MSFTDNVVGMGLTAEDCGIINNSRLTVTFIVDEVIRPPLNLHVMMRADVVCGCGCVLYVIQWEVTCLLSCLPDVKNLVV